MSIDYGLEFTNGTYSNNVDIETVELGYIPWKDNSMHDAFYNCQNLTSVTNINKNVTNLDNAFRNCQNLIDTPILPDNATTMDCTFQNCVNLINSPEIPNNVTYMGGTFAECYNLVNVTDIPFGVTNIVWGWANCNKITSAPHIPNSVINMHGAFNDCHNLIDPPVISSSVTNMYWTFANCHNLQRIPVIPNSVTNIGWCFRLASATTSPNIPDSVIDLSGAFVGTQLVNAPVIGNGATNMDRTFGWCDNLTGDIYIYSNQVRYAGNCFLHSELEKNVYIPFKYDNGVNTETFNSFNSAGYPYEEPRVNGVLLMDLNYDPLSEWRYDTLDNGIRLLYEYLPNRENIDLIVPNINTEINYGSHTDSSDAPFQNKSKFNSVDLNNVPFKNNSMYWAFDGCSNLTNVTNINQNVTDLSCTFSHCSNLVNAPVIPNSVTDMGSSFYNCTSLVNAPVIPDGVTIISSAFYNCSNLVNAPVIPSSVINMEYTFSNCSKLTNVLSIPNNVTSMYATFADCSNLVNAPNMNNANSVANMSFTFAYCRNLVTAPVIPNNVTNMYLTFSGCHNLTGDIYIHSENITNAESCFSSTTLNKDVYIPFKNNGVNTATYDSFINAGYSTNERVHGVLLIDINPEEFEWRYSDEVIPGTRLLYEYLNKTNPDVIVPNENTMLMPYLSYTLEEDSPFYNSQQFNSVDLNNVPYISDSMSNAFFNCQNLTSVTNINKNVKNMIQTFWGCSNLTYVSELPNNLNNIPLAFYNCTNLVNAPVIPNSVTDMLGSFCSCTNLVNAPVIPNSVTDMSGTFEDCPNLVNVPVIGNNVINMTSTFGYCTNLVNAPEIPNGVTNMSATFRYCTNLVNAPEIPNSVTNIGGAFYNCEKIINAPVIPNSVEGSLCDWLDDGLFEGCTNLIGDIYIHSENITNATNCFARTNSNKEKDVYIPFKYDNGVYTTTYNSFIAAGYSTNERVHGALLMDINDEGIDLGDYEYTNVSNDITLTKYIGVGKTSIVTPHLS